MIHFQLMNQQDYITYKEKAIARYAKELEDALIVKQGLGSLVASTQFDQALSLGVDTPNFYFYNIHSDQNEHVGIIIYGKRQEEEAFIFDLLIFDDFQKKGFGKKTIEHIITEAREKGFKRISLHVFGHNEHAIKLYQFFEFKTMSMQMTKLI